VTSDKSDEIRLYINIIICGNIFRLDCRVVIPGVQFKNSCSVHFSSNSRPKFNKKVYCIWIKFIACISRHNESSR
jgi:hypothetical protein